MRSSSEPSRLRVEQAAPPDLASVRTAYDRAQATQQKLGAPTWPGFSDESILAEIREGRLFRIMDGSELAGVFTVAYEDDAIWGELERGAHIYLHRIARTEHRAASPLMQTIVSWALAQCEAMARDGLRMDTWADNPAIIAYYRTMGFEQIGTRRMTNDPRLSPHYHGLELALMERPLSR